MHFAIHLYFSLLKLLEYMLMFMCYIISLQLQTHVLLTMATAHTCAC